MKFDPLVAQIIVASNFDNFTTSDVRSAYLALKNDTSLVPTIVRRSIYAELLKLVKKGWLKKLVSNKKGFTRFNKTENFNIEVISKLASSIPISIAKKVDDKRALLLSKLNHYKAELLLNMGESEAYKELYLESPELVDELQPQYNKARDNNTRILGKIRAIEGLLQQNNALEKI
ncbi:MULTISPECIES: hypothetical protein [Pseudoalteromonas]|uniref:hypothetical protein n=1 Tax=Pseudoalteromonas TaxID=53246 RepID=UPI0015FAAE3A|nr:MULTISPECIES: hypothetical protein [unclassified Pseudoalteromonas]MBB1378080.1 hypothetical protein [Pseudoalteromonas sp. SR43-2]MBH0003752.1 hypothetical protein [Pseudoalteromonas sp. SWYJZ12]